MRKYQYKFLPQNYEFQSLFVKLQTLKRDDVWFRKGIITATLNNDDMLHLASNEPTAAPACLWIVLCEATAFPTAHVSRQG
ncbi:hypothetical protein PoB_006819700 [Plakobranchus ocellatus]|uniref:Uncharacterized protein n=1 Tax=Plakobranchus ocellatus TaxID=259542 RepID=A0AAV4DCD3_9GAST|nr:hypothetical protein PoB_006819700 [Plakobranchus ocellatus]